jgi:hypothetical protein
LFAAELWLGTEETEVSRCERQAAVEFDEQVTSSERMGRISTSRPSRPRARVRVTSRKVMRRQDRAEARSTARCSPLRMGDGTSAR